VPVMRGPQLEGAALAAVRHRGSHLQIIASAGSGKTEVVSQRAADLLADGFSTGSIGHCCIWRPLTPASSTRGPERHRRCPGLIALSISDSRPDGNRLHFAIRRWHLRARCNSAPRRSRPAPLTRSAFAGFCFPSDMIVLAVDSHGDAGPVIRRGQQK
jgi:hypothetical protein